MLNKLEEIYKRYLEVESMISASDAMKDMKAYVNLSKEYKDLRPIVASYKSYKNLIDNINDAKNIIESEKDEEMLLMAKAELDNNLSIE